LDFLLQIFEAEESAEAQAVIATGLCKLLLAGIVTDSRVSYCSTFLVRCSLDLIGANLPFPDVHLTIDIGEPAIASMPLLFLPRLLLFIVSESESRSISKKPSVKTLSLFTIDFFRFSDLHVDL